MWWRAILFCPRITCGEKRRMSPLVRDYCSYWSIWLRNYMNEGIIEGNVLIRWADQFRMQWERRRVMVMEEIKWELIGPLSIHASIQLHLSHKKYINFDKIFNFPSDKLQLIRLNRAGQMAQGEWCITPARDQVKTGHCKKGTVDGVFFYDEVR